MVDSSSNGFRKYLDPGKYINSDNPDVVEYANKHKGNTEDKMEQVVNLYYAIRDGFKYDPFNVHLQEDQMKASGVLNRGYGYCVEKAGLLAACARVLGVPSRIGMADVRNHVGAEKLQELLRSDVFACHGFTELYLDGQWVKATPAFNKALCEKLGVEPLEFNGKEDSIFQEYDQHETGERKFMEYLYDHGTFEDIPRDYIIEVLQKHYPHLSIGGVDDATIFNNI